MMFNVVDLSILIAIGFSIFVGVLRGMTREVLGIAGWVGALATVFYGLPLFRPLGHYYISNPMLADAIVSVILFILSLAVFILISRLISTQVKASTLGGLDRSLGLIFGFLRGIFVICLVYLALGFFYPPQEMPRIVNTARLSPLFAQGAHKLKLLIPQDYLPSQDSSLAKINPLDAKDLIENSLPSLEETVKNLSTLRPSAPKKPPIDPDKNTEQQQDSEALEKLIERNDANSQK